MPEKVPQALSAPITRASVETGIGVVALSATYNMIHPDEQERAHGHRRLAAVAEAASDARIPLLTLCTGTRDPADQWKHHPDNDAPEAWRDLLQSMETAIGIAERFDLDLGIEPELANVVNSAPRARRLIDDLQSGRIRIVFDPANLFERETRERQRSIISHGIDLLAGDIAMAHAKDRLADGTFVAAGRGVLDYRHFLTLLKKTGFAGPLVTHGLSANEAPAVAAFLRQKLQEIEA
jgi:sugar phosphate isomerase/epimerase